MVAFRLEILTTNWHFEIYLTLNTTTNTQGERERNSRGKRERGGAHLLIYNLQEASKLYHRVRRL